MKIGQAATASGLTIKAIRHYEATGLVGDVERRGSYRDLSDADVERLRLIAHCRALGFSLPEIKRVLALVAAAKPECPPVDAMLAVVETKLDAIRCEIRELRQAEEKLAETKRYLEERLSERTR